MTDNDKPLASRGETKNGSPEKRSTGWTGNIFSIPPAVERVFDNFPLVKYEEDRLPIRAPSARDEHVLYVFASESDARDGRPSYNPTCLKWQTYLKFAGLPFRTVSSSNHASPSGALPFLLPAISHSEATKSPDPVPTKSLRKWLAAQKDTTQPEMPSSSRYEAYAALLDNRIRKAWLYQLYLSPANASAAKRLYVDPCSRNPLVRMSIEWQLQQAAASEIVNASTNNTIIEEKIMREAGEAFNALSTLLAEDQWFFGLEEPGFFDACVFAYTHLIRGEPIKWESNTLLSLLEKHGNLLRHQRRIADMYY